MSLVLGITCKNLVIVSNDSKVTKKIVDFDTLEEIPELLEETEIKHDKVKKITNKVLLSTTGLSYFGDIVKEELIKRTNEDNDLKECSMIAKEVIAELSEGEISGFNEEDRLMLKRMFSMSYSLSGYLFGFNHSGTTGVTDIRFNNYTETPSNGKNYPAVINGPNPEYDFQFRPALFLNEEERTIENFIERIAIVHAHLSHKHNKNVSTDCNFHILINNGEGIEYKQLTIDTLPLYERLGLEPQ